MTTVGYGDKVPATAFGRIFAAALMVIGVVVTSILSGTIASIFVDRKIKEGKGLQDITLKGHVVVCGWNRTAGAILDGLQQFAGRKPLGVVLINEADPEDFQVLVTRYPNLDLRLVRGDFTNEITLRRGAAAAARAAIVVSDTSGSNSAANADERTILGSLAVKSLNPSITISAEIANPENEQHLRRAKVDSILIAGEFNGFLFAASTFSKGLAAAVKEMLSLQSRSRIRVAAIPSSYVGKTFGDLMEHFIRMGKGILIGLLTEEKKISFDDLISDDTSAIEVFIKRKFAEASIDLGEEQAHQEQVMLNPGPDHVITDMVSAFVIGESEAGQL